MLNKMDRITSLVKERLYRISGEIGKQYKNTDPYRKVKMTDEESVAQYMSFDPEVKEQFRTQSPEAYASYESKIQKIMEGYNA